MFKKLFGAKEMKDIPIDSKTPEKFKDALRFVPIEIEFINAFNWTKYLFSKTMF